jgi:hypothetical protein
MSPSSFPEVLDATILTSFLSCQRHTYFSHFLNHSVAEPSIDLHAGASFAAAVEAGRKAFFGDNNPNYRDIALEQLWLSFGNVFENARKKDIKSLSLALIEYFTEWPLENSTLVPANDLSVEHTFAIPLHQKHPETGHPLIYAGRYDWLVHDENGLLWIMDEKTTTSIGEKWADQWRLRFQFLGYLWAAYSMGLEPVGVIVRGIGLLKTKTTLVEVRLTFPHHLIEEWIGLRNNIILSMKEAYEWVMYSGKDYSSFFPNFSSACTSYGGCPFMEVCLTAPDRRARKLASSFSTRKWNPLSPNPEEDFHSPASISSPPLDWPDWS